LKILIALALLATLPGLAASPDVPQRHTAVLMDHPSVSRTMVRVTGGLPLTKARLVIDAVDQGSVCVFAGPNGSTDLVWIGNFLTRKNPASHDVRIISTDQAGGELAIVFRP
jgi:hypothetical protein